MNIFGNPFRWGMPPVPGMEQPDPLIGGMGDTHLAGMGGEIEPPTLSTPSVIPNPGTLPADARPAPGPPVIGGTPRAVDPDRFKPIGGQPAPPAPAAAPLAAGGPVSSGAPNPITMPGAAPAAAAAGGQSMTDRLKAMLGDKDLMGQLGKMTGGGGGGLTPPRPGSAGAPHIPQGGEALFAEILKNRVPKAIGPVPDLPEPLLRRYRGGA